MFNKSLSTLSRKVTVQSINNNIVAAEMRDGTKIEFTFNDDLQNPPCIGDRVVVEKTDKCKWILPLK